MFLSKRSIVFLFLFFVFSRVCTGQYKYREIKHPEDKQLVFPVFINENKNAAKRINDLLQMDFFETTTAQAPGSKLFDDRRFISDDVRSQTGYTSISYMVEINNAQILSVIFEVEGMGAYPTYYKKYFSFYTKNGRLISADTLFTTEGIGWVRRTLINKRNEEIKKWVEELRRDNETSYAEDSSFIAEKFTKCNAGAHENMMFISKGKILFYKDDCFPHAWGPYETNLNIEFTYKELEKYLSDFGKKILFTK